MLSGSFLSVILCLQVISSPFGVATVELLVSLPFHVLAQIIAFVRAFRAEHIESNLFHRMFAYCDSTNVGKIALGFGLFSPTLFIFVSVLAGYPEYTLDALSPAFLPWVLAPLLGLIELRYERRYPRSA